MRWVICMKEYSYLIDVTWLAGGRYAGEGGL